MPSYLLFRMKFHVWLEGFVYREKKLHIDRSYKITQIPKQEAFLMSMFWPIIAPFFITFIVISYIMNKVEKFASFVWPFIEKRLP
jgi:hypothetical protein